MTTQIATPAFAYPRASDRNVAATWIGHSTVLLQFGLLNALTDRKPPNRRLVEMVVVVVRDQPGDLGRSAPARGLHPPLGRP